MLINVIVATRNRSANLRDLLEGLLRCEVSLAYKWDVWVIDNNSTDDTPQIVQFLAAQHPNRIHYRSESAQGKSFALNRGIRGVRVTSPYSQTTIASRMFIG
jgi:1,2-diacylglycerol 3-beta-glucosyltransferase